MDQDQFDLMMKHSRRSGRRGFVVGALVATLATAKLAIFQKKLFDQIKEDKAMSN